jgi:hypothetical protein
MAGARREHRLDRTGSTLVAARVVPAAIWTSVPATC